MRVSYLFLLLVAAAIPSFMVGATNSSSENIITVSPQPGTHFDPTAFDRFTVSIAPGYEGRISVNDEAAWYRQLIPTVSSGSITFPLTPIPSTNQTEYFLILEQNLPEGDWTLDIPEGYFRIDPVTVEEGRPDIDPEELLSLPVYGAWHKAGSEWTGQPMFTIHDDDTLDGRIPSSNPSAWMKGGYYSTLYPLLESLGLRGCLSMEGWRAGFIDNPPALNGNGLIARRLQDEKGDEIQSHSMTARYQTNSWCVDSLGSELADRILAESTYAGLRSNNTTSVYDRQTGKSYYASPDKSRWIETPAPWIKPYVADYDTKRIVAYNPLLSPSTTSGASGSGVAGEPPEFTATHG